ncbi:MAG: DUF2341 domain-containing protein [Candidatus Pacearchaeota archaeon]
MRGEKLLTNKIFFMISLFLIFGTIAVYGSISPGSSIQVDNYYTGGGEEGQDFSITLTDKNGQDYNLTFESGLLVIIKEINPWSDWNKKMRINITENSGSSINNYTIDLIIPYNSSMNADYSDLRFLNCSENSEYGYWIYFANSTEARVHVRIEDNLIPSSSDNCVYVYYGNPSATTTQDIAKAHIVGEDGSDFSEWTEVDDNNTVTLNTSSKRVEFANLCRNGGGEAVRKETESLSNFSMSAVYNITKDDAAVYFGYADNHADIWSGTPNILTGGQHSTNNVIREVTSTSTYNDSYILTENQTVYVELDKLGTNFNARYYLDQARQTLDATQSVIVGDGTIGFNVSYMLIGFDSSSPSSCTSGWITNYTISKYIYPEPTYSIGSEELI